MARRAGTKVQRRKAWEKFIKGESYEKGRDYPITFITDGNGIPSLLELCPN